MLSTWRPCRLLPQHRVETEELPSQLGWSSPLQGFYSMELLAANVGVGELLRVVVMLFAAAA